MNLWSEVGERDSATLLDDDDERYRWTVEVAPVGIAHVSHEGRYLEVNPALCRLLGYSKDELLSMTVWETSHPDDKTATNEIRAQLYSGQVDSFCMEKRYVHKGGRTVWVQLDVAVHRNKSGEVLYDIAVIQDISSRKRAEQRLRTSEQRFKSMADLSSHWYWESDADGRVVKVNGVADTGSGLDFLNESPEDSGLEPRVPGESLTELQHRGEPFHDQLFSVMIDDSKLHLSISGRPFFDDDGTRLGFQGACRDITPLIEAEDRIRFLASHDTLTGLPNRETFTERLSHALVTAARFDERLALAFVDIDHFKMINDSLGHAVGDKMLREVAERLVGSVRGSDVVARFGGDEFVVLIQGCNRIDELEVVAKRIVGSLSAPVDLGSYEHPMSASVGLACFPGDGTDGATLMKNADLAMYEAKESGKGRYQFFQPSFIFESEARLTLEDGLRNALDHGELTVDYKPRFDVVLDQVAGVSAVLGWMSPGLGRVDPEDFMPLAEATGLIVPIGRWVLGEACRRGVKMHADADRHEVVR